jgi:hypothetical protein
MMGISIPIPTKFLDSLFEEELALGIDHFVACNDFSFYHGLYHIDVKWRLARTEASRTTL